VLAQDLIRVIFKDMNPIWLRSMWEVSDRTKFGYSQENEPLGRIALRKYRDRTTENGVL
jgi:hypothetical protein